MLSVQLKLGNIEERLYIDLSNVSWNTQNIGAKFGFIKTHLDMPFKKIFVKRWETQQAPAHELLLSYHKRGIIPHTPPLLAYRNYKGQHYYIFTMLIQVNNLNNYTKKRKIFHVNIITRKFIETCLKNLIQTFSEINKRGFYYADFDYKNMMVDFKANKIFVIDVDSCASVNYPIDKILKDSISHTWYTLYVHLKLKNHSFIALNQTMIISFALIWCKALAEIESEQQKNVADILRANPQDQKKLFSIFEKENIEQFKKTYKTQERFHCQIPKILSNWHRIFDIMKIDQNVDWTEIASFVYHLLFLSGKGGDKHLVHIFKVLFRRLSYGLLVGSVFFSLFHEN